MGTTLRFLLLLLFLIIAPTANSQDFLAERTYVVDTARQGVAVDKDYFYVINNKDIVKYRKDNGQKMAEWRDTSNSLHHMNSGVIVNSKLYCAHSNYPNSPMASSIEIFDPKTLTHIGNISLGIYIGSITWLDYYKGHWYVAFAHYSGRGSSEGKTPEWSQLIEFTKDWERIRGWTFPKEIVERFGTRSNSGGVITRDGKLLITGHDNREVYELELPTVGHTLVLKHTYPVPFEGQGIALDNARSVKGTVLYGIIRRENKVIKAVLKAGAP